MFKLRGRIKHKKKRKDKRKDSHRTVVDVRQRAAVTWNEDQILLQNIKGLNNRCETSEKHAWLC